MSDSQAQSDEEYVRSKWEKVYSVPVGEIPLVEMGPIGIFNSWSAAAAFTRDRERDISFIEAELDLLNETRLAANGVDYSRWKRIIEREYAALATLKRGMR